MNLDLYFNIVFFIILSVVAFFSVYYDVRQNKIPNKLIVYGLFWVIFFHIIFLFIGYWLNNIFSWEYFLFVLLNALITLIISFILWNFKLWAGGDAKLLSLYSLIIPLAFYSEFYIKYWPSFSLMVNVVLVIFIYLLIKFLIYPLKILFSFFKNPGHIREYIFRQFDLGNKKLSDYFGLLMSFFLVLFIFQTFKKDLALLFPENYFIFFYSVYFLLSYLLLRKFKKIIEKKVSVGMIVVVLYLVIGLLFFKDLVLDNLHEIFALQGSYFIVFYFLFRYGQQFAKFVYKSSEVRIIPIEEIEKGININKEYLVETFGNRLNIKEFKEEVVKILSVDDKDRLMGYIEKNLKDENVKISKFYLLDKIIAIFSKKDEDLNFLSEMKDKLGDELYGKLMMIMSSDDEFTMFLKTIKGRLTQKEADKLIYFINQRNEELVAMEKETVKQIILHKTFSFAPFMLLGVLITLLTKSNIIHLIYVYILHR